MTIYSGFSHWKWWFSIAMLVYQRVLWKFIKIRPFFSHSPHVLPWQPLHIPGTVRRPVSQARFKAHQPMGRESRMLSTRFSGALGFHGKHGETWGNIGKLDLGILEVPKISEDVGELCSRLPSSLSYRGRPPPRHRQMILWENKVWARPTRKNWPHCRSRHILSGREHKFHLGVWSGHVSSTNCHRVDC